MREIQRAQEDHRAHKRVRARAEFPSVCLLPRHCTKIQQPSHHRPGCPKIQRVSSHLAHVPTMTTFYSSHEYGCRRADSCERTNASHVRVNLRQNPPSTSILKQTHPQQTVTKEGSIHPICYNSCTLPLNIGKTRTKFLNLRDSVKKSPTKSTAKVSGPGERFSLWPSVSFDKVRSEQRKEQLRV